MATPYCGRPYSNSSDSNTSNSSKGKNKNKGNKISGSNDSLEDRIVGGREVAPNRLPWAAALTLNFGFQFCGGSIISQWVSVILELIGYFWARSRKSISVKVLC